MSNKKPDPYPVTVVDIDRQVSEAKTLRGSKQTKAKRVIAGGLLSQTKHSYPMLIQHL